MGREEIAAAQKLELAQAAEQEITEMRAEARLARERLEAAAASLAARLGSVAPESAPEPDSSAPLVPVAEERPSAPDFADIADRIVANE